MSDDMAIMGVTVQNRIQDIANQVRLQTQKNVNSIVENKFITDIQNQTDSMKEAAKIVGAQKLSITEAETVVNKVEENDDIAKTAENMLVENALTHGAVLDFPPPEGSTISYHI